MDRQTFISLFKDLVSRLYDLAAVETHPLAPFFPLAEDATKPRAGVIQQLILDEIEQLRPEGKEVLVQSPEWRPYLILRKRYVEGEDPHEVAKSLYVGDRQFRRDHSRALQALSLRVWQRYFQQAAQPDGSDRADLFEGPGAFELHAEQLDLNEVLEGIINLIARRLEIEDVELVLRLSKSPLLVFTDRVLLRQILLSLFNYVLHLCGQSNLTLSTGSGRTMSISILFEVDEQWSSIQNDERDTLEFARRLSKWLPAVLEDTYPPRGKAGPAEIRMAFAASQPRTVLVVDDQVAAQRMFQRYLTRANLEVVGITDPSQVLMMAQRIQPALIILDVMMPHTDGWEVLQTLQLDPETKKIPVLVCSAWGEPELARSLGAVTFLKKPVVQKDLLDALIHLGLVQE
jgi:CheY-like chemotaxis protein